MSNWWDRKLSSNQPEQRQSTPPTTPNHVLPVFTQQRQVQPNQHQQADPNGQMDMSSAIRVWKGGEAHRIDGGLTCPRCGSGNVFSRANASAGGNVPAPRCFQCGWNGMYEQADQVSWSI